MLLATNAHAKQARNTSVVRAYIDSTGSVHIVDAKKGDIKPTLEKDQVDATGPIVADDHLTVGWLVEYPNCCTSYPIPLTIVIYRGGKIIRRFSNSMMIYTWHFVNGGKQLALSSGPVHGKHTPPFELYDIQTGQLLEKFDGYLNAKSPHWTDNLSED